jgi:cation:H+ antiporter
MMADSLLVNVLLILAGLAMLYFGSEWLVRGSVSLAKKMRVSQLVIGLTIVAFGTSSPELVVSIGAAFHGQPDIAHGNVVGSNIVNIGLILGLSAVIFPLAVHVNMIRREIPVMIGIAFVLVLVSLYDGVITQLEGALLVAGILAFTFFSYRVSRKESAAAVQSIPVEKVSEAVQAAMPLVPEEKDEKPGKAVLLAGAGVVLLYFGASFTVDNAVVATAAGISERVVGLTIVAIGTSLPELITSVIAAKKKQADLIIGNVVGSNVFNVLAIIGVSSAIAGISVNPAIFTDYAVMIGFSLVLLPLLRTGFVVSRKEGLVPVAAYCVYLEILLACTDACYAYCENLCRKRDRTVLIADLAANRSKICIATLAL